MQYIKYIITNGKTTVLMVINIKQATTFEARKWLFETTTLQHDLPNTFSIIGYTMHEDLVHIYVRIIFKMLDLY